MPNRPTLAQVVHDDSSRSVVAGDAVYEARSAIKSRSGVAAVAAGVGFDAIERLRPGLLERHVHAMLPDLAQSVEPYWLAGLDNGDPESYFEKRDLEIAEVLLGVVDRHVEKASDTQAIGIYNRLRGNAPKRIAEQMPRLAQFIDKHTPAS